MIRPSFALPQGLEGILLAVFIVMGVLSLVYAFSAYGYGFSRRGLLLNTALLVHILGGITALLAADCISLLVGWELLAFSGFFIIVGSTEIRPGPRFAYEYIAFQIIAAASLFTGIVIHYSATQSLALTVVSPASTPAGVFILFAVALKTAAMPLHFWLVDSYPAAHFSVSPLLSVYGTKVGVYTAARLLSVPVLPYLGAFMALTGVLWALRQHSARKLLSYHIISQVGYMLIGVGLAGEAGINAGIFHAVNHIIYKALLFMVIGAVIYRTGEEDLRRLGGLGRYMPLTFLFGVIASASIAGLPFFSGYTSKALLKSASGPGVLYWIMTIVSAGTGLSFIKLIYAVFLRPRPRNERIAEAPAPMLAVMAGLALCSVLTGVFPSRIPFLPEYRYYTADRMLSAVLPLAAASLMWLFFGRKLLLRDHSPGFQFSGLLSRLQGKGRLLLKSLVRETLYSVTSFQVYILVALTAWAATAVLFILRM